MTALQHSPVSQRMEALLKANEVRCAHARIKQDVHGLPGPDACDLVAVMLEHPEGCVLSMRVGPLLRAIRKIGAVRTYRWLSAAGVRSLDKRIGDLTPRQREALVFALRADGREQQSR